MAEPDIVTALIQAGSAGLVILVVVVFLKFIERRDHQWQQYFKEQHQSDVGVFDELRKTLETMRDELISFRQDFARHDAQARQYINRIGSKKEKNG